MWVRFPSPAPHAKSVAKQANWVQFPRWRPARRPQKTPLVQSTFASGILLNAWFLVALAIPAAFQADGVKTGAWPQALAWLIGSAGWIAVTWVGWLVRGKKAQPTHMPEFPEDRNRTTLTRPMILFASIRAVALSVSVAIAFGSGQPNADWMPIATLIAMKPTLNQSALAAEQRIVGALLGALIAGGFLLALDNKVALEILVVLLGVTGGAIYAVNYALYTSAIAGAVLIALDLPHASGFAVESRRILFTLAGVAIGVGVMLLANLMKARAAKASGAQPAAT
jgi:Fusaric acid resistance protein-like